MRKLIFLASIVLCVLLLPVTEGQAAQEKEMELTVEVGGEVQKVENLDTVVPEGKLSSILNAGTLGTGKVVGGTSRMRYLDIVRAEIHITPEGVATVYADATSYSSQITNMLVVAELQQLINGEWTTLRTYRCFTGDYSAIVNQTCNVSRGYYYRVVNTATAYAGNDSETKVLETPSWNFYVPGT